MALSPVSDLGGKVALVTAAGGAIGSATACRLAADGARVVCADLDATAAEATADRVRQLGGDSLALAFDALDASACQRLIDRIATTWGGLHVVCHLVGYFGPRGNGSLDQIDLDRWQWMLDINLKSVFLVLRAAIPALLASGGGSIITTGTLAAVIARGGVAYGTSKAAVLSLTRAMASEYQALGIRVNCVCPSATDSPMYWSAVGGGRTRAEVQHTVQGLASPEQIAECFAFLASARAARITGHLLMADNGFSAFRP